MRWPAVSLLVLLLPACRDAESSAPARIIVDGFATPESVVHDEIADVYLVSNINGAPTALDDNGFISRVSPDGKIEQLKWIDGAAAEITLHAPKGMVLIGDALWVADVTAVRKFDRVSGKPLATIEIPGATFLNDVAMCGDLALLVSDTGLTPAFGDSGTDALYRIDEAGKVTKLTDAGIKKPNGVLAITVDEIVFVTWESGELVRCIRDKPGARTKLPKNQLDGVAMAPDGSLLVTSWADSCVYNVSGAAGRGAPSVAIPGLAEPADLTVDRKRKRVLIPLFKANQLVIVPLTP
jgi:sugar lactone lactonase YvrE